MPAEPAPLAHAEFIAAWRRGGIRVDVSPDAAAFVSSRLMLPFMLLPVFGVAVALALAGHLVAGIVLFVSGIVLRFIVRRSAPGFILQRALHSASFYDEVLARGLLRIVPADHGRDAGPEGA